MDKLRVAMAPVALAVPSVVFAFNVAAILVWRRSLVVLVCGAIVCAIHLASAVASGPAVFIAYWIVALVLVVQALPLVRRPAVSPT